jgi:hypothetical protein
MTVRLVATSGALYAVLLVGGDDFLNPAGEVPGADASVADVAAYVARADASRYWLGRSVGLLGVCCLLVFVAHVAARTAEAEGEARTLSRVLLAAGSAAGVLQFLAAPPQFASVLAGDELDPAVSRALLLSSGSFVLSFLPLGVVLGAAAVAGLRFRVLPRWLALVAALIATGLVVGMVGRPQDPGVEAYLAFALSLPWFVATSIALTVRPVVARQAR